MKVLIVTHSEDNESVARVAEAVAELGGEPVRLDTDLFPTESLLACRLGDGGQKLVLRPSGGEEVDLGDVGAVYYRRFYPARKIPGTLDEQLRRASVEESRRTLLGLIASLDAFQLDRYDRVRRANHKQLQLHVARGLGLTIPDTLITNDAEAVRRFAADHPEGIVAKMLSSFAIYDEAGNEQVVFTTPLGPEDLEEMDGLDLSPMTFQQRLPKALELRVTVVGRRLFVAAVDSQSSERATEDWRRDGVGLLESWHEAELPPEVGERLLALCDRLGLNYGAVDLILTPGGRYVFLEINPVGEYFWLERFPGLPISRALAEVLVDPGRRRVR
jgi:glutathione synthase/RimK-type ligase-like ATP-grasp enzyme